MHLHCIDDLDKHIPGPYGVPIVVRKRENRPLNQ
jgi:hypothetical protein